MKIPAIFKTIQETREIDDYHMYQTFNMGIGMEAVVSSEKDADEIIKIANSFNIDAAIIGYTEGTNGANVVKINNDDRLIYTK